MTRTLALIAAVLVSSAVVADEVRELAKYSDVQRVVAQSRSPIRVVNLWATWCGPCVAEMADLQKLSERFPRVALIGISLDDAVAGDRKAAKTKVAAFLRDRKVRYSNYYFTGREAELADGLGFEGLPVTIVYGSDGKEITRVAGRIDYDSFAKKLASLDKSKKR